MTTIASPVKDLISDPETRRALEHLFVVDADFDRSPSPERENALEKLRRKLVDESKAEEARAIQFEDAVDLCATGSRRVASDLIDRLAAKEIRLRDATPDEAARAELESIRIHQLEQHYPELAAEGFRRIQAELEARGGDSRTRAEAMRLLAHAHLSLKRVEEAREAARRATELDPNSAETHAVNVAPVRRAKGQWG